MRNVLIGKGKAVHALPDNKATLCGKPADETTNTSADIDCKACLKLMQPAETSRTAVAQIADDFNRFPNVPELIALGAKRAREGVSYGIKMGSTSEALAGIMLDMRTRIPNEDTGLPDITALRKTTKNAAAALYAEARKDVAEDDEDTNLTYDALVKSVQNRMADVLISWLHSFDTADDDSVIRDLFPDAAESVDEAREAHETAGTPLLSPSEAIRALYRAAGVELPARGRREIERERQRRNRLAVRRGELETALDEGNEATVSRLRTEVAKLEALLPDAVPVPEKTPRERAFEKLAKADTLVSQATKGASKMTADERAALKSRLQQLVTELAVEAASL